MQSKYSIATECHPMNGFVLGTKLAFEIGLFIRVGLFHGDFFPPALAPEKLHNFCKVFSVVGGDPHLAAGDEGFRQRSDKIRLEQSALVMTRLGPWVREVNVTDADRVERDEKTDRVTGFDAEHADIVQFQPLRFPVHFSCPSEQSFHAEEISVGMLPCPVDQKSAVSTSEVDFHGLRIPKHNTPIEQFKPTARHMEKFRWMLSCHFTQE